MAYADRSSSYEGPLSPPRRPVVLGEALFSLLAIILDCVTIVAAATIAGVVYHIYAYENMGAVQSHITVGLLVALFYSLPKIFSEKYSLVRLMNADRMITNTFLIWNYAFFAVLAIAFLLKMTDSFSRGTMVLFYMMGLLGVIMVRSAIYLTVREAVRTGVVAARRAFLIGHPSNILEFQQTYAPEEVGIRVVGAASVGALPAGEATENQLAAFDRALKRALAEARSSRPDDVFILLPWSERETIERCIEGVLAMPVSIHLGPERVMQRFPSARIARVGAMASLNLVRPPLSTSALIVKRASDIVGAALGLVLLAPLFLVVAALIKRDSKGPVFFVQGRMGFNNRPFRIYKFRTMTTMDDGAVVVQAQKNDARITRVGHYLRKWNIDELPQLINVLRGEMSLVGPRPHALAHDREYEEKIAVYARRHNVKPGITGWAQVNGLRGPTDTPDKMEARVEADLYYIDNWSIVFDAYIVILTVFGRKSFDNAF